MFEMVDGLDDLKVKVRRAEVEIASWQAELLDAQRELDRCQPMVEAFLSDDTPIENLELPKPVIRILRDDNIRTIGELILIPRSLLLRTPLIGRKRLQEIETAVARHLERKWGNDVRFL